MIIIFGWMKETKPIRPILETYCYHCQKQATWYLWRETEWVSFFDIKTVPFIWKNYLVCSGCEDVTHLDWPRYLKLSSPGIKAEIAAVLEEKQLKPKNEIQRRFLLTQRAEREASEKSPA